MSEIQDMKDLIKLMLQEKVRLVDNIFNEHNFKVKIPCVNDAVQIQVVDITDRFSDVVERERQRGKSFFCHD